MIEYRLRNQFMKITKMAAQFYWPVAFHLIQVSQLLLFRSQIFPMNFELNEGEWEISFLVIFLQE